MPWSVGRAEARADWSQREVPADARLDTRMLLPDALAGLLICLEGDESVEPPYTPGGHE